jgi:hypothetical protein
MAFSLNLHKLLIAPNCVATWHLSDWDRLLQQAYASGMLAKVYVMLQTSGNLKNVPVQICWHFNAANSAFEAHKDAVLKEVEYISKALSLSGITATFLKGAAYLLVQDKAAEGRIFSDVDIFVEKSQLSTAEHMLGWQGWSIVDKDDYDQAYYRDWMHELPPLTHELRGTTVDVHHNLLPIIGRVKLDAAKLQKNICIVSGQNYAVLSPEDRVLHSAAHLFLNGEFDHGFRDLYDLDQLLRQHQENNVDFIPSLIKRAEELGLASVLYYCFRYTNSIFNTPLPESSFDSPASIFVQTLGRKILHPFMFRALQPRHSSCSDYLSSFSLLVLFIRGHWLKMPLHILLYHSIRKASLGLANIITGKNRAKDKLDIKQP